MVPMLGEEVHTHHCIDADDDSKEEKGIQHGAHGAEDGEHDPPHVIQFVEDPEYAEDAQQTKDIEAFAAPPAEDVSRVEDRQADNDEVKPVPG